MVLNIGSTEPVLHAIHVEGCCICPPALTLPKWEFGVMTHPVHFA